MENLNDLIPKNFKNGKKIKNRKAGIFAGSLELVILEILKLNKKIIWWNFYKRETMKKENRKKDNILNFPTKLTSIEKEIGVNVCCCWAFGYRYYRK